MTAEMTWCGGCVACRNGFPNQCERLKEIGVTYDGGFAEYLKAPAKLCWSINGFKEIYKDEDILFDIGATIEPNVLLIMQYLKEEKESGRETGQLFLDVVLLDFLEYLS